MGLYGKSKRVYKEGLAYKLERAKHNKSEDWEVPMNKRKNRFDDGGVAEIYNGEYGVSGIVWYVTNESAGDDYDQIAHNVLTKDEFDDFLSDGKIERTHFDVKAKYDWQIRDKIYAEMAENDQERELDYEEGRHIIGYKLLLDNQDSGFGSDLPYEVDEDDDSDLEFRDGGELKEMIKFAKLQANNDGYDSIVYEDENGLAHSRKSEFERGISPNAKKIALVKSNGEVVKYAKGSTIKGGDMSVKLKRVVTDNNTNFEFDLLHNGKKISGDVLVRKYKNLVSDSQNFEFSDIVGYDWIYYNEDDSDYISDKRTNEQKEIEKKVISKISMTKYAKGSTVKDNRMNERTRAVIVRLQKNKADPEYVSPNYVNDVANKMGVNLTSEEVVFISDNFGEKYTKGGGVEGYASIKESTKNILIEKLIDDNIDFRNDLYPYLRDEQLTKIAKKYGYTKHKNMANSLGYLMYFDLQSYFLGKYGGNTYKSGAKDWEYAKGGDVETLYDVIIYDDSDRIVDSYYGVSEQESNELKQSLEDVYESAGVDNYISVNVSSIKTLKESTEKYNKSVRDLYERRRFESGQEDEYAKGGGINSGRDLLFKSKQPHEQKYKRKTEWKEYNKEGWFGDWFAKGGGVGYGDIKKEKEKMTDDLLKKCGVFFAFSNEQFLENKTPLKEGEKYVSIGGGGYMPKGKVKDFQEGMKSINQFGKNKVKENNLAETEILYELNNHECFYTGDYSDVVDMFKGTYTEKQIRDVYNKHRESNQDFKNGGGVEDTIAERYARLTETEANRLDELSKKVRINEQTESEDIEWDKLVHKYRGWDYKYANGGDVKSYLLSIEEVESKIGRKLNSWHDDIVSVGSLNYKKVYLKPFYKIIN